MPTLAQTVVGSSQMDIYLDGPQRSTRGPAVLLMYHRGGIDAFTKRVAARLTENGYVVAVPDVSHRCSPDVAMPDRKKFFKDSEVVMDMEAALAFLRADARVDGERIAIMGHCMGGRMTLLGAGRIDAFKCAVVLYGGGTHLSWGEEPATPFDTLRNIRCPVMGFFGNLDKNPAPEHVDAIDAELTRHGVAHTFHRYPDVGHGFQNREDGSPAVLAAAEDAWAKTLAFLGSKLGA